jgi:hypothetical protein
MTDVSSVDNVGSYNVMYLSAKCDSPRKITSGTWSNRVIIMNNIQQAKGIEYDTVNGIIRLDMNKTWRITAQLGWEAKTPEYYQFGLYDMETGGQIGPLAEALPPNKNSCNASGGLLDVIVTSSGGLTGAPQLILSKEYQLRMSPDTTAGPSSFIRSDAGTFLNIAEVPLSGNGCQQDAQPSKLFPSGGRHGGAGMSA